MPNYEIEIAPSNTGVEIGTLDDGLFGGILINQSDFEDFSHDYEEIGLTFIRFPGGTIAEDGVVVDGEVTFYSGTISYDDMLGDRSHLAYDLTHPELFNPDLLSEDELDSAANDYASLSEVMAMCVEDNTMLAIILPTTRYFHGVDLTDPNELEDMLALAESDLLIFLDRLVSGEYNDGIYPEPIIFEIGNETYGSPIEYATIAAVFIETIEEVLGPTDIVYEIAFQMNNGSSQYQALSYQDYFDQYFDEDGNALIPQLVGFSYEPSKTYSYGERILMIEQMMVYILGDSIIDIDLLRHHYLAVDSDVLTDEDALINQRDDILQFWLDEIDASGGDSSGVEYYVSAWTTDSSNTGNGPAGLAAATSTLQLYSFFIEVGVDYAAAWGFNGSERFWPENSPTTVLTFSNQVGTTPGGQIIQMLSEDTIGLTHIQSSVDQVLDPDDPTDYLEFIYTSVEETVIFYSIGELDGDTLSLTIDLSSFGYFTYAEIENLGTEDGSNFGLAVVEYSHEYLTDNLVTITFDQSYEVIKIHVVNEGIEGTAQGDVIEGTPDRDFISGNEGADSLSGWRGDDTILGDKGDDVIYGNAGSDELYGGSGSDSIFGADEFDLLLGGDGNDYIFGGSGDDVMLGGNGSDQLLGGDGDDLVYANAPTDGLGVDAPSQTPAELIYISGQDLDWSTEVRDSYGSNTLNGGGGNDILVGGKGDDTFIFEGGHDTIEGFQVGLDVIAFDFSTGTLASHEEADLNALTVVSDDDLIIEFDSENSLLIVGVEANDIALGMIVF